MGGGGMFDFSWINGPAAVSSAVHHFEREKGIRPLAPGKAIQNLPDPSRNP